MNGTANPTTSTPTDTGPARAAVDNVIRRALKISDPGNPDEVAKGLLARYGDEAQKIDREKQGLPFTVMTAAAAARVPSNGNGLRQEARGAQDGLESALNQLTTDPDLADIAPELRGWVATIRKVASDGFSSARYAIDAGQRDRAFGARRTLGDYSRLSRYAGALSTCSTDVYCRVAQACDLVANVVLVMIGDALGNAGITRSNAILQVPAATLQARRDAVIVALRNLLQVVQPGDEETWGRGPFAVNQIYIVLEAAGEVELRSLLDEAYLARQLDDLIDLATGSTPDGLRALGSPAAVTVRRLERFRALAQPTVAAISPPASLFFAQINLFVQGFANTNAGYRLPYLARSPLLVSSVAASVGVDLQTQALLTTSLHRTAFADAIDCLCCTCNLADARALVIAGKVLFDIDRAIDLWAVSGAVNGYGENEWRAAAYASVIGAAAAPAFLGNYLIFQSNGNPMPAIIAADLLGFNGLAGLLNELPALPNNNALRAQQLADMINRQLDDEQRWSDLVSSISPLCQQNLRYGGRIGTGQPLPGNPVGDLIQTACNQLAAFCAAPQRGWPGFVVPAPALGLPIPPPVASSLDLVVQRDLP
jgi:hypothetical protein